MHLAFLTPEYPNPRVNRSGGIGTSIKNLAEGLIQDNHKVTIFIFGQNEDAHFSEGNINFHLIKTKTFKFLGWYLQRKAIARYINRIVISKRIDAIEAPDWTGITAFMKLKCPVVIRCHGTDAYFCNLENRPQKKKNFFLEKKALKAADHIISVSRFNAKETTRIFQLKKDIEVIHNGINIDHFSPVEAYQKNNILYFGTIIRKKGVLELPGILNKVIEIHPNIQFRVAGKDATDVFERTSTITLMKKAMSKTLLQNTTWLGELDYKSMREEIANAHIIVLPSFAEAFPMTWLESMAMQKALVTSNIGWAKELMVHAKTGFMEHPENTERFAEHILEFLKDEDLVLSLGKTARERIKKDFSIQDITTQNIDFYTRIVS